MAIITMERLYITKGRYSLFGYPLCSTNLALVIDLHHKDSKKGLVDLKSAAPSRTVRLPAAHATRIPISEGIPLNLKVEDKQLQRLDELRMHFSDENGTFTFTMIHCLLLIDEF